MSPVERSAGGGGGGTSLTVTDGTTSVASVATLDFTSGATVTSGGAGIADVAIPSREISYTEVTTPVNITSTVEASGTLILDPGAVVFNGNPVLVEVFAFIRTTSNGAGGAHVLCLFEGATEITEMAAIATVFGQCVFAAACSYRFTPTAASHHYTLTGFVSNTTGTPRVNAGSGGTGGNPPAYIRFSYA